MPLATAARRSTFICILFKHVRNARRISSPLRVTWERGEVQSSDWSGERMSIRRRPITRPRFPSDRITPLPSSRPPHRRLLSVSGLHRSPVNQATDANFYELQCLQALARRLFVEKCQSPIDFSMLSRLIFARFFQRRADSRFLL